MNTLNELLYYSDTVSCHASFNARNHNMFDENAFNKMRKGSYFVNTARGGLVDEQALTNALKSGHIRSAAVDVLKVEPFDLNLSPLRDAPNITVTPHSSWFSEQSLKQVREAAATEMRHALIGLGLNEAKSPNCINRKQLNASLSSGRGRMVWGNGSDIRSQLAMGFRGASVTEMNDEDIKSECK